MTNKQLADTLQTNPDRFVVADSAEPKSNDEIKSYGVKIIGAEKGKDSVNNGIQIVQGQRMFVTKRSVNVIKEYRNYLWETDKNDQILNVPEHAFSHSMDAIRYAITSFIKKPNKLGTTFYPQSSQPVGTVVGLPPELQGQTRETRDFLQEPVIHKQAFVHYPRI
jgi:phage terminase large subunit